MKHRMNSTVPDSQRLQENPTARFAGDVGPDPFIRIDDFWIMRELGRGGMGIVYEAEQISLGRRVALKLLPFAAQLDPRRRQRFRNEALAAAGLDHPNIVTVHAVGEQGGTQYYAMQYVNGINLSDVIREARFGAETRTALFGRNAVPALNGSASETTEDTGEEPQQARTEQRHLSFEFGPGVSDTDTLDAWRHLAEAGLPAGQVPSGRAYVEFVARLAVQAADALDYAHENGVVHRDIKPSNLLLDAEGRLWITDFGVARLASSATLTMSGELMGTLRYMSPEQALGNRAVVDHRTDIYSLGATLYELLTLQPVFAEDNPQELLHRVAFDEPCPPCQLNTSIPTDLETILLKAMAKSPDERYTTARDLADDLTRFLQDKPIRAKRPTLSQRVAKWSRRHKTVVTTAIVATIASLAVGTVLLWREQARTNTERLKAVAAMRESEDNLQKARDAVDRMLTRVAEDLVHVPKTEEVRRRLLEDALQFYEGFLEQKTNDPDIQYQTALAFRRVGSVHEMLGNVEESETAFRRAVALLERLVIEFPARADYRRNLAECRGAVALRAYWSGKSQEAAAQRYEELFLWQKLVTDFPAEPDYRRRLAVCHTDLGNALHFDGRDVEAEQHLRRALEVWRELKSDARRGTVQSGPRMHVGKSDLLPGLRGRELQDDRRGLAHAHHWLGDFLRIRGPIAEAEQHMRRALALRKELAAELPDDPEIQGNLAHVMTGMSKLCLATERDKEAEDFLQQGITIRTRLAAEFPGVAEHRRRLAHLYLRLADRQLVTSRIQEAATSLERSTALREELVDFCRSVLPTPRQLASSHCRLGVLLREAGEVERSDRAFRQALMLAQEAVERTPDVSECWSTLGRVQFNLEDWDAAIRALEHSREIQGANGIDDFLQAMAHQQLGHTEEAHSCYQRAVEWMEEHLPADDLLQHARAEAAAMLRIDEQDLQAQDNSGT